MVLNDTKLNLNHNKSNLKNTYFTCLSIRVPPQAPAKLYVKDEPLGIVKFSL